MQSGAGGNGFKKLLQICHSHNIVNFHLTDVHNTVLQYGPFGSLLKRNIFNEWLSSFMNNGDVNLFPLEIVDPYKQTSLQEKSQCISTGLVGAAVRSYFESLPLIGHKLPFGFVTYGPYQNKYNTSTKISSESDFIFKNFKSWNHNSVVFFCPPKKSMHWFYYWSKQRYLWWRKLSSIPSMFSMSEMTKSDTCSQQLSLLLQFPWGKEHLELITMYENKLVEEALHNYCSQNNCTFNPNMVPYVVTCETGLDLAVVAYLSNSFAERYRDGHAKNILQLHYKLAPYKVCLLLEGEKLETTKKLKNVANHLSEELRNSGIFVFPITDSNFSILTEGHFNRFDEMGVPYIIVLNENSLQSGVAGLRNRDTALQEQVHITEITSKLMKYLKVKN